MKIELELDYKTILRNSSRCVLAKRALGSGRTGHDLAEAFSAHFSHGVSYEAVTPEAFAASVAPFIGEAGAAAVLARYRAISSLSEFSFSSNSGAQQRLNVIPRSTRQWLDVLRV